MEWVRTADRTYAWARWLPTRDHGWRVAVTVHSAADQAVARRELGGHSLATLGRRADGDRSRAIQLRSRLLDGA